MPSDEGTDHRLRRTRRDRCIVFLHIPKTGGVTLRRALKWKYPSRTLYAETLTKPLEAFEQVPLSERASARVISGHLHYGVHEYIPQECEYVTVLREPVARVISSYHYILGDQSHWLHADLVRSDAPWEEFLRTEPTVDNHQTRMISGRGGGELTRAPEPLDPDALEKAKRNLERFLVVGLTERFDETFLLLRRALRWKLPFYLTANVTRRPKRGARASSSASASAISSISSCTSSRIGCSRRRSPSRAPRFGLSWLRSRR